MSAATSADSRLDAVFSALADPTRRAIVRRLAAGDATVGELAAPFAMSQPAISKHLKVLERSRLISRSRNAQFRPCHLEVTTFDPTIEWISEQRGIWNDRFDKLEQRLEALQQSADADADRDA